MNKAELIDEVKLFLGSPPLHLEIDDTQWDPIINKGLRWFKAKKGFITCSLMSIVPGQSEYEFPEDAYAIVDVALPQDQAAGSGLFPGQCDLETDLIPSWVYGFTPGAGPAYWDSSSYVIMMQTLELRRSIFANDQNWYENCGKFHLSNPPTQGGRMLVYYKKDTITIEDFQGRDLDLITRYILALSKHVLGRIRSKYPSFPSAGGSITQDGEALLNEAQLDFEKLEEEITGSQGNAGGIVVG